MIWLGIGCAVLLLLILIGICCICSYLEDIGSTLDSIDAHTSYIPNLFEEDDSKPTSTH